jgi:hypothetical protein
MHKKARLLGKHKCKLPTKFDVRVFEDCDQRYTQIKRLRRTLHKLMEEVNADTIAKQMLCRRVIFLAAQLESMEVAATETKKLDFGRYTQSVNALSGLLAKLGLERQCKPEIHNLESYIHSKSG